jgi:hypothetical protein
MPVGGLDIRQLAAGSQNERQIRRCKRSARDGGRNRTGPSGYACLGKRPRYGARDQLRKIGLKALAAILTVGQRSKKHPDRTLAVAVLSTVVTIGLVALYVWHGRAEIH